MTHRQVICAGQIFHEALAQSRQCSTTETKQDTTNYYGYSHRHIVSDKYQSDNACEIQEVLSGKENRFERCELCKYKVHDKSDNKYQSNLGSVSIQSQSSCKLNLSCNTCNTESGVEQGCKIINYCGHCIGSDIEYHESNNCFYSSTDSIYCTLLLKKQTDQCNKTHNKSRIT